MSKKHIKHDVFEKGLDPTKPHSLIGSDGRLVNPAVVESTVQSTETVSVESVVVETSPKEEVEVKSDLNVSKPKRVPPPRKKSTDNQA